LKADAVVHQQHRKSFHPEKKAQFLVAYVAANRQYQASLPLKKNVQTLEADAAHTTNIGHPSIPRRKSNFWWLMLLQTNDIESLTLWRRKPELWILMLLYTNNIRSLRRKKMLHKLRNMLPLSLT
jgi:hypothetical protein